MGEYSGTWKETQGYGKIVLFFKMSKMKTHSYASGNYVEWRN